MNRSGNRLIYFTTAGMELCWLHAWTAFLLLNLFDLKTPLGFTLLVYFGGSLTTRISTRKNRLVIQHVLIQVFSFSLILIAAIHQFLYKTNHAQILAFKQFVSPDKEAMEWLLVILIAILALVIWKRGSVAVSVPIQRENMYHRFDLGISAFAVLLIISSLLVVRFDAPVELGSPMLRFIPFFLFGLLTIGITIISANKNRSFSSGFHKIGIALGFSLLVIIIGLGLVLLFTPQMSATAENISLLLKKAGGPISNLLIIVVRFLWGPRKMRQTAATGGSDENQMTSGVTVSENGLLEQIFGWILIGFALLAGLFIILLIIHLLFRLLFRKSHHSLPQQKFSFNPIEWLLDIIRVFRLFSSRLRDLVRSPRNAEEIYFHLERWGRAGGVRSQLSETPTEYGNRLCNSFPTLDKKIAGLVHLVNSEIYGKQPLSEGQKYFARATLRNLSLPIYWPIRIKNWILSTNQTIPT